jgi:hypothetical protein
MRAPSFQGHGLGTLSEHRDDEIVFKEFIGVKRVFRGTWIFQQPQL